VYKMHSFTSCPPIYNLNYQLCFFISFQRSWSIIKGLIRRYINILIYLYILNKIYSLYIYLTSLTCFFYEKIFKLNFFLFKWYFYHLLVIYAKEYRSSSIVLLLVWRLLRYYNLVVPVYLPKVDLICMWGVMLLHIFDMFNMVYKYILVGTW
jgi:hypothetical protein